MHWVIQENIFREGNHQLLIDAVKRLNISHTIVKVVPFVDEIQPDVTETGLIYCCGSVKLARIAKKRGWVPGSFLNENHRFERWLEHWGSEMLNADAVYGEFGTVAPPADGEFFIRPCEDNKAFSGKCFYPAEFIEWRTHSVDAEGEYIDGNFVAHKSGLKPTTPVMLAPFKKIQAEYRFFVVDKKIVTGSQYKLGVKLVESHIIDKDVADYAQTMVDRWQPARAFVIDIARTEHGLRIVEVNNINSSGFYDCNVMKMAEAIESMVF